MTTPAVRLWYALMVSFLACVVVAVGSVWYADVAAEKANARANAERAESDRRWCDLMAALDDAYKQNPPTTPAGLDIASKVHKLRVDLGCQ